MEMGYAAQTQSLIAAGGMWWWGSLLLTLVLGACFGSFVTLAAWRLPREEDIIRTPSRCPRCRHVLSAAALVPVLSWLWQRGRCRYCAVAIPLRYMMIEMLLA